MRKVHVNNTETNKNFIQTSESFERKSYATLEMVFVLKECKNQFKMRKNAEHFRA